MIRSAVLILLALTFPVALASEFDALMGDLEKFEEDIEYAELEQKRQDDEQMDQEDEEIFPGSGRRKRREEAVQEERTEFLTLNIEDEEIVFDDVPSESWFYPYVESAVEEGIVSGYADAEGKLLGIFGPGDSVTTEQLAKIAVEAAGIQKDFCKEDVLNELAIGSWSERYIACAEELGWAVYSDGAVLPERKASRAEVVVTVLQAFHVLFDRGEGRVFADVHTSIQFSGAIERAAKDEIVSGHTNNDGSLTGLFKPFDPVNRAETAKIVMLAKEMYQR